MKSILPVPHATKVSAENFAAFPFDSRIKTEPQTILGINFVKIPKKTFIMGAKTGTTDALDDTPEHEVKLSTFFISTFEITNDQYLRFVRDTRYPPPESWGNSTLPADMEDHPVTGVSWFDAVAYCRWLSAKTGMTFRLPTEAEWECASINNGRYPWGEKWSGNSANTSDVMPVTAAEVGSFSDDRSRAGVMDMGGNVREWVHDYYSMSAYASSAGENPPGPFQGSSRVVRGGSFKTGYKLCRRTRRGNEKPENREDDLGFRVVLQNTNQKMI